MKEHGVYNMVFSSSCVVYGNPQYLPIDEAHPTGNVTNVYGRTKYAIEQMFEDICRAEKVSFENVGNARQKFVLRVLNSCAAMEHYPAAVFQPTWSPPFWEDWGRSDQGVHQPNAHHWRSGAGEAVRTGRPGRGLRHCGWNE